MTNDDKIMDAVYRVIRCAAEEMLVVVYDTESLAIARIAYRDDCEALAIAYIARLAADEQPAKVDAEPIGREWFNENGNDVSSIIVCRDNIEYEIEAACGNPSIGIDLTVNDRYACKIIHIPHVTTRGQLRKLLEALKGGA